ncbi:MAG: Aspartate ammonia-lyase [Sodalis sp.]|nr:MAG: Aspartate ammonia-lyase [Sodalis sp.]
MDQFPVDVFQGGAGTSVNMNINEVLTNIALGLMGHQKGEYQFLNPNDHLNLCQSTNDAEKAQQFNGILKWAEPSCRTRSNDARPGVPRL